MILHTAKERLSEIPDALLDCCDGLLCKQDTPLALVDAVFAVLRGDRFFSDSVRAMLCSNEGFGERHFAKLASFSVDELLLLWYLAEQNTAKEIANSLHKSPRTVEKQKARLAEKLGVTGRELVRLATLRQHRIEAELDLRGASIR